MPAFISRAKRWARCRLVVQRPATQPVVGAVGDGKRLVVVLNVSTVTKGPKTSSWATRSATTARARSSARRSSPGRAPGRRVPCRRRSPRRPAGVRRRHTTARGHDAAGVVSGPISVVGSSGLPTRIAARQRRRTSPGTRRRCVSCSISREPAMQAWPWLWKIAQARAVHGRHQVGVVEHDVRALAARARAAPSSGCRRWPARCAVRSPCCR